MIHLCNPKTFKTANKAGQEFHRNVLDYIHDNAGSYEGNFTWLDRACEYNADF